MTVKAILLDGENKLKKAGIETARLDARVLAAFVLETDRTGLFVHSDRVVTDDQRADFDRLIARRLNREPVAHLTGAREFWSLPFVVTPDTLVPRPDSETVVEAALEYISNKNAVQHVLDLGTGTGCLLLSVLSEMPEATGLGMDANSGAVETARLNAEILSLLGRARFVVDDWTKTGWAGRIQQAANMDVPGFDVIVTNPPYIASVEIGDLAPEVARFDPLLALDGGPDGLEPYRIIAQETGSLLRPGGVFICEIGQGQETDVAGILQENGLQVVEIKKDLSGVPRVIVARIANINEN